MTEASPETNPVPVVRAFHQKSGLHLVALICWAAAWMLAQSLFDAKGFGSKQQVMTFAVLATVVYGAAFIARRDWFYQLLTSVQFAVSQLLLMALAVALGTLIPQGEAPDFYASTYGPFLQRLVLWTHAAELYHSLWFCALLSLLALSMVAVAWKRRPYPAHRVGFLLVHLSTSVILLGALWGAYSSVRAHHELREGESTATFYKADNLRPNPEEPKETYALPDFRIQLNHVTLQQPPKFKLYAFVQRDGKGGFEKDPKAYDVEEGMKARLPHSKLHFSVERLFPNAMDVGEFINNPTAPENPALRVMLGIGSSQPVIGDLFAHREDAARRDEPGGRFAVVYQDRWSPGLLDQLRSRAPRAEKIAFTFGGKTTLLDARVGASWDLPTCSLKVENYYPDFAVVKDKDGNPHATSRSSNPIEPWLELTLRESGGTPRRVMLSARNPGLSDQLNAPNLPKGLSLGYVRLGEERQSRFVVFTRDDQTIRLVQNGRVARSEPLQLNKPFIVEKGLSATAVAVLDRAEYLPAFVPHPDAKAAAKFERPVLRVKVWDPDSGRSEEKWLDSLTPDDSPSPEAFFDKNLALLYKASGSEPKDYRSELVVLDAAGRQLTKKTVSLHDPLIIQGHRFYPSNHRPADPGAGGIIVVRESGHWLVYLGFLMLILGVAWMFYLKPILKHSVATGKVDP